MNACKNCSIFWNINTLFDFYSILFGIYRGYFLSKGIEIQKLKHTIEGKNLNNGLNNLLKNLSNSELNADDIINILKPKIDTSFKTIKPVIGALTTTMNLQKNGHKLIVYSDFEPLILDNVIEVHKSWLDFDKIMVKDMQGLYDMIQGCLGDSNVIIIDSSVDNIYHLKEKYDCAKYFLLYNSKTLKSEFMRNKEYTEKFQSSGIHVFEKMQSINWDKFGVMNDIKWNDPEYFLNLDALPINEEIKLWGNFVPLEPPIILSSKIIHGFGRGAKSLGIPTANLFIDEDISKKIQDLTTGVYFGYAQFLSEPNNTATTTQDNLTSFDNQGKRYKMVMSIGFNPYYDNNEKTAEAHLIAKFDKDFYDTYLKVEILGFLRNEGDFMAFENLLAAIHNDVQFVKDFVPK